MKTAEEMLKSVPEWNFGQYRRYEVIQVMKAYAQQACEKVRQDCADNAKVKSKKEEREEIAKVTYPHFDGWEISVDKQSILQTPIELT